MLLLTLLNVSDVHHARLHEHPRLANRWLAHRDSQPHRRYLSRLLSRLHHRHVELCFRILVSLQLRVLLLVLCCPLFAIILSRRRCPRPVQPPRRSFRSVMPACHHRRHQLLRLRRHLYLPAQPRCHLPVRFLLWLLDSALFNRNRLLLVVRPRCH